jgi:hypothetical protein
MFVIKVESFTSSEMCNRVVSATTHVQCSAHEYWALTCQHASAAPIAD